MEPGKQHFSQLGPRLLLNGLALLYLLSAFFLLNAAQIAFFDIKHKFHDQKM